MSTVPVTTPQATYSVTIASGLLGTLYPRLRRFLAPAPVPRLFVVTSPEIWALWRAQFLASFPADRQPCVLFLSAGERYKRMGAIESLAQQLALAGADRDSILLAFGGGVVGDMTGFLAAIYMRGIRYVGIPTTMLAQVDSSLGGKTGANLLAGKNLIGAFHHPLAVLSDIEVLQTLPTAELRSGLQEAVKAAIIRSPALFRFMEKEADAILGDQAGTKPDSAALGKVVAASVRVKAEVVGQDEKESGLRMILNFGHTIGHAIETATRYRQLLHGEAIAWGSIAALHVSLGRSLISQASFGRMQALILRYGPIPPFRIAASPRATATRLVSLTSADKKTRSGRRAYVLTTGIGSTQIAHDVTDEELQAATESMLRTMQSK